MSHKIKSSLYFASLVLALVTYYSVLNNNTPQNNEMAQNTTVQVTTNKALN